MSEKTPSKHDTLSSQVLEYFRNYSRDQNLSSYLRGVVPQPAVQIEREMDGKRALDEEEKAKFDQTDGRDGNISPTSSLTSNRKLEWDNGADIGYENSNNPNALHKSFSLPSLTTLEKIEWGKKNLKLPPENSVKIYYSSSSSDNVLSEKPSPVSTKTTLYSPERKFDTTSSSSLAFKCLSSNSDSDKPMDKENILLKTIRKKVGYPIAQSTPNIERSTSAKQKGTDNVAVTELKCVAKFTKSNIVKLMITKPITIDCINYKEYFHKDIQTMKSVEFKSKSIQTENLIESECNRIETVEEEAINHDKQVIEYITYSDSSGQPSSRSIGTNTVSDLVSHCNSFEYLCPSDVNKSNKEKLGYLEIPLEKKCTDSKSTSSNEPNSNNSEKTLSSNVTEVSSVKSTPLGDMISSNLSNHLTVDIEKSIALLQRLMKSKRYDKVTKEYFVKKIVDKILKFNYSSDSSSSSNKKSENVDKVEEVNKKIESSSSSKVSEKLLEPSLKERLHENVPWLPISFNKSNLKLPKLEMKIFSNDIYPENELISRKVKDPVFTLPNSEFIQQDEKKILNYFGSSSSNRTDCSVEKKLKANWKENLTNSEKLFEARHSKVSGDRTDSLVKFAKKERENQLNWINSEILHLNKLKGLLQETSYYKTSLPKATKPEVEVETLMKPHAEDMNKIQKSAAVYMITTDKTGKEKNEKQRLIKPSDSKNNFIPDMREAKLISSAVYKSHKPFTCIRRYVFEIPMECTCNEVGCVNKKSPHEEDVVDKPIRESAVPEGPHKKKEPTLHRHEPPPTIPENLPTESPTPGRSASVPPDSNSLAQEDTGSIRSYYVPVVPHSHKKSSLDDERDLPLRKRVSRSVADLNLLLDPEENENPDVWNRGSITDPIETTYKSVGPDVDDYQTKLIQTGPGGPNRKGQSVMIMSDVVSVNSGSNTDPAELGYKNLGTDPLEMAPKGVGPEPHHGKGVQTYGGKETSKGNGFAPELVYREVGNDTEPLTANVALSTDRRDTRSKASGPADLAPELLYRGVGNNTEPLTANVGLSSDHRDTRSKGFSPADLAPESVYRGVRNDTQPLTANVASSTDHTDTGSKGFSPADLAPESSYRGVRNDTQPLTANVALSTDRKDTRSKGFSPADFAPESVYQGVRNDTQPLTANHALSTDRKDTGLKGFSPADLVLESVYREVGKGTEPLTANVALSTDLRETQSKGFSPDKQDFNARGTQYYEQPFTKEVTYETSPYPQFDLQKQPSTDSRRPYPQKIYTGNNFSKETPLPPHSTPVDLRNQFISSLKPQELEQLISKYRSDHGEQEFSGYHNYQSVPEYDATAAEQRQVPYQYPRLPQQLQQYQQQDPNSQPLSKKSVTHTESVSSTSSTTSSQTVVIKICPCCKRRSSKYKSILEGLPMEIENSLCPPCYMRTNMTVDPTTGQYQTYPDHICNCYTLIKTQTVNKIKETVRELERLENENSCCSNCSENRCGCHRKSKKGGVAYMLTLDEDDQSDSSEPGSKRKSLDEIRLKVPSKRKHHKSKKGHKRGSEKHRKSKSSSKVTLQEYLCTNRPNFVQNAEERRKILVELAYMREQRCQKYKQLLAMTDGKLPEQEQPTENKKKGLYSSKEMKTITAKNYKKLPEVQKKLDERRENENRKANRLLASIFNKKLRQNALRGNVDLSTTTSVIKFV